MYVDECVPSYVRAHVCVSYLINLYWYLRTCCSFFATIPLNLLCYHYSFLLFLLLPIILYPNSPLLILLYYTILCFTVLQVLMRFYGFNFALSYELLKRMTGKEECYLYLTFISIFISFTILFLFLFLFFSSETALFVVLLYSTSYNWIKPIFT